MLEPGPPVTLLRYCAPAAWNTLPPSLQQLTNTDSFKAIMVHDTVWHAYPPPSLQQLTNTDSFKAIMVHDTVWHAYEKKKI